jgi:hypothetical protein
MHKPNKRSKAPRETTGPRVGAIVTRDGVTVRTLGAGERETLPRATVLADDGSADAIRRAAMVVAERVLAHARQPIPLTLAL